MMVQNSDMSEFGGRFMNPITVYLTGLGLSAVFALSAVLYLRPHLRRILVDLCGTEPRADFWCAFTNVVLVLVPLVFALHATPDAKDPLPPVLAVGGQIKWALAGLAAALIGAGLTIARSAPCPAPGPR